MLTLQNYFIEPNYDILYETNVDQLFDIFEKNLNKIDNNIEFDKIVGDFLEKNHIEYREFKTENKNLKQVKASWGIIPNTSTKYITIEYPNRMDNAIKNKQISRSILHEMIHVLNDNKIPNFITKKNKNDHSESFRFDTRNTVNPHTYNFDNINIDDMIKYLEYVSHIREKANFAFTIALSCYFDMNNISPYEIFEDNFKRIKEFATGEINTTTFNNYLRNQKSDSIELLTMQWAMFHVGQKKYINQIYSILRLSVKYWKRLNKLFGEPYAT
jgi:hypothetical protein